MIHARRNAKQIKCAMELSVEEVGNLVVGGKKESVVSFKTKQNISQITRPV